MSSQLLTNKQSVYFLFYPPSLSKTLKDNFDFLGSVKVLHDFQKSAEFCCSFTARPRYSLIFSPLALISATIFLSIPCETFLLQFLFLKNHSCYAKTNVLPEIIWYKVGIYEPCNPKLVISLLYPTTKDLALHLTLNLFFKHLRGAYFSEYSVLYIE